MGSLMKKQAERFLREKKRHRRWLAMFLCLALAVTSGTFAALRMNGHAMDHGGKILNCRLRVHAHSDECFDGEGKMICGQADYAVHTHDARCHNDEGELVCQLPEREAHVHDSACYAEEKVLTCKEEETAGHQHSPECYIEEPGELVCSLPEHEHSELCYDELGNLVCGQEAHYHDNSCYAVNEVLICGQEEGQGGHAHTDACYETQKKLTCKELELHTHDRENCYDANGNLTCGKLELQEHEHGEGCFEDEEIPGMDIENEEYLADGELDKNALEESASDNAKDPSEEQVSENSVSGDSVSQDAVSENSVSENSVSENSVSENSVSDNSVSENSVSENSVSGNGVSKNSVSENNITLETNVDGITISLSGPESSFDTDKELSIQAKKVKDDEQIEAIEKAVDKLAEKKDKEVKDYQAFDITLLADGKEVQPLGPVEVKFSGKKVEKAVENKKTDVEVLHVGEETEKPKGEKKADAETKEVVIETKGFSVQDMKATATEEKEVVIETEHFSVYVYVNLTDIFGKINVRVEHWGDGIKVLKGEAVAKDNKDTIIDQSVANAVKDGYAPIQTEEKKYELYSADVLEIPNEYYKDIEKLSKVCEVKPETAKAYDVSKVWISQGTTNSNKGETWADGTYAEYTNTNGTWKLTKSASGISANATQITLKDPSVIRFWYKPKENLDNKNYPVTFYDYDITNGKTRTVDGKTCYNSDRKGINADSNYTGNNVANRLGVGQWSAGNFSSWAITANKDKPETLKQAAKLAGGEATDYLNQRPTPKSILQGMVEPLLTKDENGVRKNGNLQFSPNVIAPNNLFTKENGNGKTVHSDYELSFQRYGDTLILDKVYKGSEPVESNLSKMTYMQSAWAPAGQTGAPMFSNNFWPMDTEQGADPHAGKGGSINFTNGTNVTTPGDNDDQKYYPNENAHNWYFGMEFTVNFKVGDYTGPMEYYFRGDDDFWLFIDGKLAVDIGGIHQVAGQSIDLRAWMDKKGMLKDKNEQHTMKIYYMERGAWGSCCYMQFILPNTEIVDIPKMETTEYSVTKDWDDGDSPYRPESIKVRLVQEWGGDGGKTNSRLTEEYAVLSEENGWKKKWTGIPLINGSTQGKYNYSYKVEEVNLPPGYTPVLVDGKLTNKLNPVEVKVEKKWQNDDGLEQYRPESIRLQLYANGEPYKDKEGNPKIITLPDKDGNWSGVFENLPEYYNYRLVSNGSDPSQDKYDADEVIYSVRELDADGKPIESNGQLTTEDGVQYAVTYTPDPTVTPPTSSAPNKAPAHTRPSQGMPELDEAGPDEEIPGEVEEEDEESSDSEGSSGLGNEDITEDEETETEAGENAEGNEEEGFSEETTVMNTAAVVNAAAYDMPSVASVAGASTEPPAEDSIVADLTVTNTLDKNFKVVKRDSSDKNTGATTPLSGAEFKLTQCNENGALIQGGQSQTFTSGEDGKLAQDWEALGVGYYRMEETKAPAGYMLSRTKWIIQIVENDYGTKEIKAVRSFEDYSGYEGPGDTTIEYVNENSTPIASEQDGLVFTYTFYNDEIYELPSTGGEGVYWYTISGMLLMMGASLILYKNRRRQAVRR